MWISAHVVQQYTIGSENFNVADSQCSTSRERADHLKFPMQNGICANKSFVMSGEYAFATLHNVCISATTPRVPFSKTWASGSCVRASCRRSLVVSWQIGDWHVAKKISSSTTGLVTFSWKILSPRMRHLLVSTCLTARGTRKSGNCPQNRRPASFGVEPRTVGLQCSVFWSLRGIIKVDFLDKGCSINSEYYSNLLRDVRKSRRKSPGVPLWLLQDNAPVHTSHLSMSTSDECGFEMVQHPPYSPDLAPSDFALFRHLKQQLKGIHFDSPVEMKERVEEILNSLTPDFFKNAFVDLLRRWKKCVDAQGSYVEK